LCVSQNDGAAETHIRHQRRSIVGLHEQRLVVLRDGMFNINLMITTKVYLDTSPDTRTIEIRNAATMLLLYSAHVRNVCMLPTSMQVFADDSLLYCMEYALNEKCLWASYVFILMCALTNKFSCFSLGTHSVRLRRIATAPAAVHLARLLHKRQFCEARQFALMFKLDLQVCVIMIACSLKNKMPQFTVCITVGNELSAYTIEVVHTN
jgi:hypothetical protein